MTGETHRLRDDRFDVADPLAVEFDDDGLPGAGIGEPALERRGDPVRPGVCRVAQPVNR